ncbi:hypothetical protein GPA27_06810 [Aromatoleum toluolicum]|uniref:Uncharacterized protein n=1 Tax=Aromatoleum toluolicum TaxID=90060 RepID=A0ABX1NCS6_9RHOO|nr:hypothetical protein [Aromatoleum toluolicum]NMF97095.1 hypothetical protein [Aromatoleum toluolicum]
MFVLSFQVVGKNRVSGGRAQVHRHAMILREYEQQSIGIYSTAKARVTQVTQAGCASRPRPAD